MPLKLTLSAAHGRSPRMSFQCGIVGLPNVGKSTIFNALTGAGAAAENYPFCTIDPNTGIVPLRDARLDKLREISQSEKVIPSTVEFIDIAGLVKGASNNEGRGNEFLSHIRGVDAIAQVVRCFDDDNVVHVHGKVDPSDDAHVINMELLLADLDTVDKRLQRVRKLAKTGNKDALVEQGLLERYHEAFANEQPARTVHVEDTERTYADQLMLLTNKPLLYVANLTEETVGDPASSPHYQALLEVADAEGAQVVSLCGKIEAELSMLDEEERTAFLEDLGLKESGLDRLAHAGYALLGLVSFFTTGPKETRAWTITKGSLAPTSAGKIHSDIERGFIRAETYHCEELFEHGSEAALKNKGLIRQEGKEYVVQDGDVIFFKFNV